jgi:hypothetical protein
VKPLHLALWLVLAPSQVLARQVVYALAVGNNAPPSVDLPVLSYADDDATRFFAFFSRFADQARLLTTPDAQTRQRYPSVSSRRPTRAEMVMVVEDFAAMMRADRARGDEVLLYLTFSGHGGRTEEGTGFLALEDGGLDRTALRDEVLAKLPFNRAHLIIDACHASAVVSGRGTETDAPHVPLSEEQARDAFAPVALGPDVGMLLATTDSGTAHEWSQIQSGIFTHEVLSGLSGAADADGDGAVSYPEISAFLAAANRDVRDPRAVPHTIAAPPPSRPKDPLLPRLAYRQTATLTGRWSLGHFFIELANGERYLDAHLSPDFTAQLRLPAEPLFLVADDREVELQPQPGQQVSAESLSLQRRSAVPKGSIDRSFRDRLFLSAFGPRFYADFLSGAEAPSASIEVPQVAPHLSRRPRAVGSLIGAGASAVVAGVFATLSGSAYSTYQQTQLQRPAVEAFQRSIAFGTIGACGAVLAVALGVVGWLLWVP